jgi:hypothetical protein
VRALARKRQQQRGSAKTTASRLVSTISFDAWMTRTFAYIPFQRYADEEASKAQIAPNRDIHKQQTTRISRAMRDRTALKAAHPTMPLPKVPLDFLAIGDSWFEYPLDGNSPSFDNTAIVAQSQLQFDGFASPKNPQSSSARPSHDGNAVVGKPGKPYLVTRRQRPVVEPNHRIARCHPCICRR